jgi:hypothetical protein
MVSPAIKSASLRKETKSLKRFLIPMDFVFWNQKCCGIGNNSTKASVVLIYERILSSFLELRTPFKYPYKYILRNTLVSKLGRPSDFKVWILNPKATNDKASTKASTKRTGLLLVKLCF